MTVTEIDRFYSRLSEIHRTIGKQMVQGHPFYLLVYIYFKWCSHFSIKLNSFIRLAKNQAQLHRVKDKSLKLSTCDTHKSTCCVKIVHDESVSDVCFSNLGFIPIRLKLRGDCDLICAKLNGEETNDANKLKKNNNVIAVIHYNWFKCLVDNILSVGYISVFQFHFRYQQRYCKRYGINKNTFVLFIQNTIAVLKDTH